LDPLFAVGQVSAALEFAASRFRDGRGTSFESEAQYETADLVTIFEIERWMAKVGGRQQPGHFEPARHDDVSTRRWCVEIGPPPRGPDFNA
jgi:hypothetical protein